MTEIQLKICNKHLNYFENNIPTALLELEQISPNSVQWFTLGMLKRLLNVSIALKELIPKYLINISYDFAIGIIIRPILLDSLIGLNLFSILKNGLSNNLKTEKLIDELDTFCNRTLADGLEHTVKYFKQLHSNGIIEVSKLNELYNHFAIKYSDFLEQKDGVNTMPKARNGSTISATNYFQSIVKDKDTQKIAHRLYDIYTIYSKYDHFGFLFFEIDNYDDIKSERIFASISLFVNHYANMCDMLQRVTPSNSIINSLFQSSKNYLEKKNSI